MSRALREALDNTARARDESAAAYLRKLAVREVRTGGDDDVFRSPARSVIPSPAIVEITNLMNQLAMLGGSVVQLCKTMRESSHPAHLAAEEVLADLREAQGDLTGLVQMIKAEVLR